MHRLLLFTPQTGLLSFLMQQRSTVVHRVSELAPVKQDWLLRRVPILPVLSAYKSSHTALLIRSTQYLRLLTTQKNELTLSSS
jgi:hypothetical protein